MIALKFLALFAALVCVYGASFYNTGVCPTGKQVGDRWNPGSCLECYCDLTGYGCDGCDGVEPKIGCQVVAKTNESYPDCCPRLVCPGFLKP